MVMNNKIKTAVKHRMSEADELMVAAIENHVMQLPEFSHEVHVKLAYCYLTSHDLSDGGKKMQDTLMGFLKAHGVSPDKFHMTITHGWMIAIWHFMQNSQSMKSANEFISTNPVLLNKEILLSHYSHELLFSDRARSKFIEPDLNPFPQC